MTQIRRKFDSNAARCDEYSPTLMSLIRHGVPVKLCSEAGHTASQASEQAAKHYGRMQLPAQGESEKKEEAMPKKKFQKLWKAFKHYVKYSLCACQRPGNQPSGQPCSHTACA